LLVRRRVKRKLPDANDANNRIQDYRFVGEKRKNIPDAGLASFCKEGPQRKKYDYDPHLDPQLVWAGKTEHTSFEVDTVALHIHERISTKAILKTVEKKELYRQLKLFAEPDLPFDMRVEFYQHDMEWTNRLVLGDSMLVMNSLLEREMMAGKVQMIYIDPPYGIAYNSNFQPTISSVNVQAGKDDSLTREPEQIKAYRDTWELGIHSYLAYLQDRLLLCKELLTDSGSVFVQISDENVHHVREILDEVFGAENFVSLIPFRKKLMPLGAKTLENMCDYLLWYAKDKELMKYRQLYNKSEPRASSRWTGVELADGTRKKLTREQLNDLSLLPKGSRVYRLVSQTAPSFSQSSVYEFTYKGRKFVPKPGLCWVTTRNRMEELARKNRLEIEGDNLSYVMYHDDFPFSKLTNPWIDTVGAFNKIYVIQTNDVVIQRCVLMTTDVGDLVFDPTCGSGTTAHVAEQYGRRWITCDTSRVALAIARQRLLCASFAYYRLAHPNQGVSGGFVYETVPHITLKSLAQNEPPQTETLYDKPIIEQDKTRVSGPFTVEAIPVPSIEDPSLTQMQRKEAKENLSANVAEDYIGTMTSLIQKDGVTFPGGKHMALENVRPVESAGFLHAEGQAKQNGDFVRVAISFGPRHGPVTAKQVEEAVRSAYMMGFNTIVFAGFVFDPEAQATIQKTLHPHLQVHMANIRPDVEMSDLLKTPRGSQLFTVFGQPDIRIKKTGDEYIVELLGVDIYDPTTGEVHPSRPEDVAAWFLDQDYNGYTFCITQAFFPKEATNRNPWDKLENALHGSISKERVEKLRGTTSLSFKAGDQARIAVKVIDQRGNEVIVIKKLEEAIQG